MASTCTFCSAHSLLAGLKFRFRQRLRLRWRWRWRRSRSQETEVDNSCTCCWPFGAHAWTTFYARMRHNAEDVTGGRCRGICSCLSRLRLRLCIWPGWPGLTCVFGAIGLKWKWKRNWTTQIQNCITFHHAPLSSCHQPLRFVFLACQSTSFFLFFLSRLIKSPL